MIDKTKLKDLFLKYIAIDTQSNPDSSTPKYRKTKHFALKLVEELKAMGISNAVMDEYGYVMASMRLIAKPIPTVGFIAMLIRRGCGRSLFEPANRENYDRKDIARCFKKYLVTSAIS